MRRLLLPFLALLGAHVAPARSLVEDWFPVHEGDRRVFEHERRDEAGRGREHPDVRRWRTEETVMALVALPEGTAAVLSVKVQGYPPGYFRIPGEQAYLIRGDCLYTSDVGWDSAAWQLKADYRQWLLAGQTAADFCFPLEAGKTWGAPHWADWRPPAEAKDWKVTGTGEKTERGPAFHVSSISSYPGSGETVEMWFVTGVGLVSWESVHHGTYGVGSVRLVEFWPR